MKKRRTYPGSIFVDKGKLYIKFKGKKFSTGLEPTKTGYQRAEMKLENLWMAFNRLDDNFNIRRVRISEAFNKFLETKINRYEKTLKQYRYAYNAIIANDYYIDADRIEIDIQNYLKTTKHGPVTINTYLTNLQIFLNYCIEKTWLPNNAAKFKTNYSLKENNRPVESWNDAEVFEIIEYFKIRYPELALMIEFMTITGARKVDCLTLEPGQIKKDSIIWKNKKTKRDEPRPITARAKEILNQLPARDNQIWQWTYNGASFLNKLLRKAIIDLGIESKGRSFQEFRSYFRMSLLKKGVPAEYVLFLMRHSSFKVTELYTEYKYKEIMNYIEK